MAQDIKLKGEWSSVPGIYVPKQEGGVAYFADPTPTTATAADVASTKYFLNDQGVLTQGTGTMGTSNWTLLTSQEFTVNTTSTTNTSVGTITLPNNDYGKEDIIWVHVRDKAGKRSGYVYGTDSIFMSYKLANNDTSYLGVRAVEVTYVTSDGVYTGVVTAYGVYAYRLYYTSSDHSVRIYSRYNATYGTIDGTFKCDVYKLTTPSGFTMYA